jgi:thiamine-phosphate pyrophosphorylase
VESVFSISASLSGKSSISNKASVHSREIPNRLTTQNEMPLKFQKPVIYLITSGETSASTTPADKDFSDLLRLVEAAAAAEVSLLQLREKNLNARTLYELTARAVEIVRTTKTRLLVNDRADIAMGAGAHGVHLTAASIDTSVVREMFGKDFLIGVSTHSVEELRSAERGNADFAVFGPVFATASKRVYGEPLGVGALKQVVSAVPTLPLLALGGLTIENVSQCFAAGAAGIAAIRLFQDSFELPSVVTRIRESFAEVRMDGTEV